MKTSILTFSPILVISLLLSACQKAPAGQTSLDEQLNNPLYAERYADEMVDRMVEYKIVDHEILQDEAKAKIIEDTRVKWLAEAKKAEERQREGTAGHLIGVNEYLAGEVLYLKDRLYLSSIFESAPGPNLHVYMSTEVDPRGVDFPDASALDLGMMQTNYGAHSYKVPHQENPLLYRTVVIWDNDLARLYGFAQLSN